MKRQSKAEEALKKQIAYIENQMDDLQFEVMKLNTRSETLRDLRSQLQNEVNRLRSVREAASIRNKP